MVKKKFKSKRRRLNSQYEISKIKKLIKGELYSKYIKDSQNGKGNALEPHFFRNTEEEKFKDYNNRYLKYMAEEFNSTLVSMFITYINKNKTLPEDFQKESNFINKFINLIKHLLMNELELACFTIILDKMGWKYENIDHWTYFYILGIYSKKLLGREEESSLLIDILTKDNSEFINYYTSICDEGITDKFNEESLTPKLLNERFKQLTRSINTYCRRNYINYNGIADKIVKWSQPYGEESNGNQLYNNEQTNANFNNNNEPNNLNNLNYLNNNLKEDYKEVILINNFTPDLNNIKNNFTPDQNNIKNNMNLNIINNINFPHQLILNAFNEQSKNNINYQQYLYNNFNFNDLNNQASFCNTNLNLVNRGSSQMSFK